MPTRMLLRVGLRLLLAWAALLGLSLWLGRDYGELLLPLYRWELGWLAPEFRTVSFEIAADKGQAVFAWSLETRRSLFVGGKWVPEGVSMSSSTLLGHAVQHPVLLYSILLAWPGLGLLRRVSVLLLGLPWLLFVELLDVPMVLYGAVQDAMLFTLAPGELDTAIPVQWMHVMNTGGRLALSIAGAVLAVASLFALEALLVRRRTRPGKETAAV